jgi:hypothetical protein
LSLALATSVVCAESLQQNAPKTKPLLEAVPAPVGERVDAAPTVQQPALTYTEPKELPYVFTVMVNGKPMRIETGRDDAWLTASVQGKKVWTIEGAPSAGGTDFAFGTRSGWNVLLTRNSRTGDILYDIATGKQVGDWSYYLVLSPDGKWALLTPWFNWIKECMEDSRVLRVSLTGKVRSSVVMATPMTPEQMCPEDREKVGNIAADIAGNGKLYVVAQTSKFLAGDGVVELFQASDDKKLGSLRTKFPSHFSGVGFSNSGKYLVLYDSPEEGHPNVTQWLRITR